MMRKAQRRTLGCLAAAMLAFPIGCPRDLSGQVVTPAQLERHALPLVAGTRVTDGATAQSIIFKGRDCEFHYTPPGAWQTKLGEGKAAFARDHISATLTLFGTNYPRRAEMVQPPTPSELKNFEQETIAKVAWAEKSTLLPLTTLPFQVGRQTLTASTVLYERAGQRYALQRVKSWGDAWQVEVELSGPEQELAAQSPAFLQSLCNIEVHNAAEERSTAAARERQAIAEAEEQKITSSLSANASARVRGRVR